MDEIIFFFVVVAKMPKEGFSKTRLAKDLHYGDSEKLYDAFIKDFFLNYSKKVKGLEKIFGRLNLFITPKSEGPKNYFKKILEPLFLQDTQIDFQSERPFFLRLKDIFERMKIQNGNHFIHLTGTDIPDFPFKLIENYFSLSKGKDDVIIGPDEDGGFYYIGMEAKNSSVFEIEEGIKRGRESVLTLILKRCRQLGLRVKVLEKWSDIDNLNDLNKCLNRSHRNVIPNTYELSVRMGII